MYLYIALYSRGADFQGSFHWALVPCDSRTAPIGSVKSYQVDQISTGWIPIHETTNLAHDERFLGCVRLPAIYDASASDIVEFIEQYHAEQGEYVTAGGVRWSCARWIIQILTDLVDAGLLFVDMEHDNFYQRIIARGMSIEGLLEQSRSSSMIIVDY